MSIFEKLVKFVEDAKLKSEVPNVHSTYDSSASLKTSNLASTNSASHIDTSKVNVNSPGISGGLSLRNEYAQHQIEDLEEKKKLLSNELVQLHVQIINTKKEYTLYHKSLLKLKKTIEFISEAEDHLAKEKAEINEVRSLLETQRRQSMSAAMTYPAREKAIIQREAQMNEREKELFAREALIAGRESALLDKEKHLNEQSLRTSHLQATTQCDVSQIRSQENHTKQMLAKINAREHELRAIEAALTKQSKTQSTREHELAMFAAQLDALKIQLSTERKSAELQKHQLTQYTKQLQQQTVLVQQKASELSQKEAQLLLNSAASYPYQATASQINTLQHARSQLTSEVDKLQSQVGTLRSQLVQTQSHLGAARSELAAIAHQRMSFATDFASAQEELATRERVMLRKQVKTRHK